MIVQLLRRASQRLTRTFQTDSVKRNESVRGKRVTRVKIIVSLTIRVSQLSSAEAFQCNVHGLYTTLVRRTSFFSLFIFLLEKSTCRIDTRLALYPCCLMMQNPQCWKETRL